MDIVIVVDMIKGFHDTGNLANPRTAKIIQKIGRLLARKAKEGYKIVFLRDCHEPDDEEFKMFPSHCIKGTEEVEIIDKLQEFTRLCTTFVLDKTRYSGFYNTYLEMILESDKPEQVIVVGVCADICVFHTVADLRNRDYKVIVPRDCVETFDAPGHPAEESAEWALNHMKNILGVKILESSDTL